MSQQVVNGRSKALYAKRQNEDMIIYLQGQIKVQAIEAIRARVRAIPDQSMVKVSALPPILVKGIPSYRQWKLWLVHRVGGKVVNLGVRGKVDHPFQRSVWHDRLAFWTRMLVRHTAKASRIKHIGKRKAITDKILARMTQFEVLLKATGPVQLEQITPAVVQECLPAVPGQPVRVLCVACGIPTAPALSTHFAGDRRPSNRVKDTNLITVGCRVKITEDVPVLLPSGDQDTEQVERIMPVSRRGAGCPACQLHYWQACRQADQAYRIAVEAWTAQRQELLAYRDQHCPNLTDAQVAQKGPSVQTAYIEINPKDRSGRSMASYWRDHGV